MRWSVLIFLLVVSCVRTSTVTCGDLTCEVGSVCSPSGTACTTQGQLDACREAAELDGCTAPDDRPGVCRDGYCQEVRCGDQRIDPGERCDDGNTIAGDGCSADCVSDETCGNDVLDRGSEECDDGNVAAHDGCNITCRAESPLWRQVVDTSFPARESHAMAYDSARKKIVLFGGRTMSSLSNETWEFDGDAWTRRTPAVSPSARVDTALAYDPVRGRVVLFGGFGPVGGNNTWFDDTWEWDGTTWTQRTPAAAPSPRFGAAMAYHPGRSVMVLYAGQSNGTTNNDTWEYNGTNWTNVTTTAGIPTSGTGKSSNQPMVYDSVVGAIVMMGPTGFAETWKYTTSWTQISITGTPPRARQDHSMAFDATINRTVLIGGIGGQCGSETNCNDAFELVQDGGTSSFRWLNIAAPYAPRRGAAAYHADSGKLIVMGGVLPVALFADDSTWFRKAGLWALNEVPPAREGCHLAYLPALGGSVLFGGLGAFSSSALGDTWLFRDQQWSRLQPPMPSPPASAYSAMVLDRARNKLVLLDAALGKTWEFDGTTWLENTTTAPPRRREAQLVYDDVRAAVVLFGGYEPVDKVPLADTWTYDGTSWTQLATSASPPTRQSHALTYDRARNVVVLFGGGMLAAGAPATTWELSGSTWTEKPIAGPVERVGPSMVYDPVRASSVIFGGLVGPSSYENDTWEYADGAWREAATIGPSPRSGSCATYDEALAKIVLVSGTLGGTPIPDTWLFGYE